MLRDPVDMFASYFYHRHPLSFRDKRALSEMSAEDLRRALDLNDSDAPWEWWELGGPANSGNIVHSSKETRSGSASLTGLSEHLSFVKRVLLFTLPVSKGRRLQKSSRINVHVFGSHRSL